MSHFKLPAELSAKKALVNVQGIRQEESFKYAVLAVLHYNDVDPKNRGRATKYVPYLNELNWSDIDFPFHLNQLEKFEKNNPTLAITVIRAVKKGVT